jgi:hypothetical protein
MEAGDATSERQPSRDRWAFRGCDRTIRAPPTLDSVAPVGRCQLWIVCIQSADDSRNIPTPLAPGGVKASMAPLIVIWTFIP